MNPFSQCALFTPDLHVVTDEEVEIERLRDVEAIARAWLAEYDRIEAEDRAHAGELRVVAELRPMAQRMREALEPFGAEDETDAAAVAALGWGR